MTRTPADLDPRLGDVLLLCRDAGDPATLSVRLRKFVKNLGRWHGIEVVSIEDVKEEPTDAEPDKPLA